MTSTELWLLRHGQSTGNRDQLRQGQRDYPLTDEGRRQAHALADRWLADGIEFSKVVTSPLVRAKETAEILAERMGLTARLAVDDRWMERHGGTAEGDSLSLDPEHRSRPHTVDAHIPPFEGAETRLELHARATRALGTLLAQGPGRYLIVAHGGILGAAVLSMLGLAPSGRGPSPSVAFGNTGFAILRHRQPPGHWVILCLNNTSHLSE